MKILANSVFHFLVLLSFCAGCTQRKQATSPGPVVEASVTPSVVFKDKIPGANTEKVQDKELQKILHWFEQMDAIFRESLWVIRKDRPSQGRSIFGKMQRALLIEMKEKLSNKSLFRCDVYSMKRDVSGLGGVPQKAEVFQKCSVKEDFVKIGEWSHPKSNLMELSFQGGNLSEVLGMVTGVLSPQINCSFESNDNGIVEKFKCSNLMVDYNRDKNQVLKFQRFEYTKSGHSILHLKAEVLENLEVVRKIESNVPVEGAIIVTETVTQTPTPPPTPSVTPAVAASPKAKPKENSGEQEKGSGQEGRQQGGQENPQEQNGPGPQNGQAPRQKPKAKPQVPGAGHQELGNEGDVQPGSAAEQGLPENLTPEQVEQQEEYQQWLEQKQLEQQQQPQTAPAPNR